VDLVRGFVRYLYVPDDGAPHSSAVVTGIEEALRREGLATGPGGEGATWMPFRPCGELAEFSERLGLIYPTLEVDWFDHAREFCDSFLSPRGPWSRCPCCAHLVPSDGAVLTVYGEIELVKECASCGAAFDASRWEVAKSRALFSSRLVVCLAADSSSGTRPTFRQGCPKFIQVVEEVIGTGVREVLVGG
jgi:hypothetical protein